MAADRHLEFSKFGILVMFPVLERDSALYYKISRLSDNHSLRYSQKTIFKMADGRHFTLQNFGILLNNWSCKHNLRLHTKFPWNQMISGWDIAINHFQNGGRPPSWIFDKIGILVMWPVLQRDSALSYKISRYPIITRWDITKRRFSIWRPSAILDLLWRHHTSSGYS